MPYSEPPPPGGYPDINGLLRWGAMKGEATLTDAQAADLMARMW